MNRKELYVIAVTVFLTLIAWVILEVQSIREDTATEGQIDAVKLEYTIDTSLLDDLNARTP